MEDEHKKKKEKKDNDPTVHSKEESDLYPAKEQGILKDETSEEKKESMEHGEEDEDIYTPEGREKLEEDDELNPEEEGFMEGATGTGQLGKDALTGEPLMGEDVVEMVIDGKTYRFVNSENADKFKKKRKLEEE